MFDYHKIDENKLLQHIYYEEDKRNFATSVSAKRWIRLEYGYEISNLELRKVLKKIGYKIDNCGCRAPILYRADGYGTI